MKLRILLNLILLGSSFSCLAMRKLSPGKQEEFEWSLLTLPRDVRQEIIQYLFKLTDNSPESLIASYKQYLNLPKTINKQYQDEICSANTTSSRGNGFPG